MAANCLNKLPGALEAVTARDRVERKKAMVSISKPTQRVHRRTTAYSHMTAVRPRKDSGTQTLASVPSAMTNCRQASTWNTVSHRKEGHMAAGRSSFRFFSSSSRSATV